MKFHTFCQALEDTPRLIYMYVHINIESEKRKKFHTF